jgi:hypothetical protein
MTEDEFHEYWNNKHQSVVKDWLVKHGVIKYVQVSSCYRKHFHALSDRKAYG